MALMHLRARRARVRQTGTVVDRSVPMERWCSRNSAVTTAQMVCQLRSSDLVKQQQQSREKRGKPVGAARFQRASQRDWNGPAG
jgi:hypothetical protein